MLYITPYVFEISHKKTITLIGAVAQLGERLNGIQEVVGSIPSSSTKILILKKRLNLL